MYKNKTFIGIIPARSGSKGLPHKNIRSFAGKPLMAWTILAARQSGILDEIFVSTDSEQYAEIAKQNGASAPFLRPPELAMDTSPASGYILHALRMYREQQNKTFDYFALLQPTTPFRTAAHIKEGAKLAVDEGLASVVSFSPFDTDLRLVHELPADMRLATSATPNDTLRQDTAQLYKVNGMLYISRCTTYENTKSFYGPQSKAMIIDKKSAIDIDIDNEDDFEFAEFIAKRSGFFE